MRKPKHSGTILKLAERRVRALELRKQGCSYAAIGAELGCCGETAARYIEHAARDLAACDRQLAGVVVPIELAKLDEMDQIAYAIATDPLSTPEQRMHAIDRRIRLQERRAKLQGLDAPDKIEHSGNEVIEVVFDDGGPASNADDGGLSTASESAPGA